MKLKKLLKLGQKKKPKSYDLMQIQYLKKRKLFNLGYNKLKENEKFSMLKNIISKYGSLFHILALGDLFINLWKKGILPEQSSEYLDKLIDECKSMATKIADTFINFLNKFRSSLIYCGIHNVSNSIIEGINSECKVIQLEQHGVKSVPIYILKVIRRFNMRRQERLFEKSLKANKYEKVA